MSGEVNIPNVVWSGELRAFGLVLKCHVLDNGMRVVLEESVIAFLKWIESDTTKPDDVGNFAAEYAAWIHGKGVPQ